MSTSLVLLESEQQVEIPLDLQSLSDFRRWVHSGEFPERGRFDFIQGNLEVDMAAEDLFCHGAIKVELVAVLHAKVKQQDLGHLFTDSTRITNVVSDLSSEPDLVFISHAAIDSGEVVLVEKASGEQGRFVEIEGSPDLVVEIVSDASVSKDRDRLPPAYFAAGVKEYWLVDGRDRPSMYFQIFHRGEIEFEPAPTDDEGFQPSNVLECRYRLDRTEPPHRRWRFDLIEQA